MFFNLLIRSRSKDWKTSWSNVRYAQSQQIEKHPRVTSGTLQVKRLKNILYLTLLQDVFQSFDFESTWRYSRMFFNLLTLSVPDVTPGCCLIFWLWAYLTTSWSNVRYAQSQKIEKHPGVTSGTLKVKRLKKERTWRYSRMFFNLLTWSVPDVTLGCFSIFWLWAYLTLLQDVFQSFDLERTWRYSKMFFNLLIQKIEKHPGVTSGMLKVKRLNNILE
jgi:hypothetical protein